jgi:hypothetical protein
MSAWPEKPIKKSYLAPNRRTFEQASLFLVGHAWNGNVGARDLLELLFPLAPARKAATVNPEEET